MREADFQFVANMLRKRSGLVLSPDKAYLMESRLKPVARKNGYKSFEELVAALKGRDESLAENVTEAMTTNESFFFRDSRPFEQFQKVILPQMLEARASKKRLRIWSAAASNGQEPYSIAMILKEEAAKLAGWRVEIVGTDISAEVLARARAGRFSQFEVQRGLPIQYLMKYFKKDGDQGVINPELRSMVEYRQWNLLKPLTGLGSFDVVFCRNVLIYFEQKVKADVLSRIGGVMAPDGFLYLGGAETVLGVSDAFRPVPGQRGVYAVASEGKEASKPAVTAQPVSMIKPHPEKQPAPSAYRKAPSPPGGKRPPVTGGKKSPATGGKAPSHKAPNGGRVIPPVTKKD